MEFQNMVIKDIEYIIKYRETSKHFAAENRTNHIIGIAFSGEEIHDFGYKTITVGENCIYFFNQRDKYSVIVNEPSLCFSIHFTTYEPIETDSFCLRVSSVAAYNQLIRIMDSQNVSSGSGKHLFYSNFHKLCSMFCETYEKSYHKSDARMRKAIEFLDLHFKEPDCLNKLYGSIKLSRRHIDKLFKEQFNTTPGRYITSKKTEFAKQLLKTPNLSVGNIAALCGFSDVFYFSKVFKANTNMSPTDFKKMLEKTVR